MKLKFIGSGSAFNTELGNNSAYMKLKNTNEFVLIDCGGDVYKKILSNKLLDDAIKTVNIFITHTHPDHCGSLGDLIFYCYYVLNIMPHIYCVNSYLKNILIQQGCEHCFIYHNLYYNRLEKFNEYQVTPIKVNHVDPTIIASGFIFQFIDECFYYSGDSKEIPDEIIQKLKNNELTYIYQDTCGLDYSNNPHLNIDKLSKLIDKQYRNKVYCMHLDNDLNNSKEKIFNYGFNVVSNKLFNVSKTVIYAGSFDPITYGHLNLIEKASKLYDKLIIGILINSKKHSLFTLEERKKQIEKIIKDLGYKNVIVKSFKGLTTDFAKKENANYLIRGIRNIKDCEDELNIANVNKKLDDDIETTIFVSDDKYKYISSSLVKEIAYNNGDISWLVPDKIKNEVERKIIKNEK